MTSRFRYAVLGAGVALAVAGCNGSKDTPTTSTSPTSMTSSPTGSATGSASASPTPSPTGTFTVPRAATQNTDEGAKAFAKWVVEEADRAYVNVDSSVFQALGEPGCKGCQVVIQGVADSVKSGERQSAPAVTVDEVGLRPQTGESRIATAFITQKAVEWLDKSGKEIPGTEAKRYKVQVTMTWRDGQWNITNLLNEV